MFLHAIDDRSNNSVNIRTKHTNNMLTFGLALAAGIGLILMMLALAVGVIQGETADANALGLLIVGGLILFIAGVAGWIGVVQPQRHFDDINIPKYTGHHGHEHPDAEVHATEPDVVARDAAVATEPHH
jgi:hypothetical protein